MSAIAAAAWVYLVWAAVAMPDMPASDAGSLAGSGASPWNLAQLLSLFVMWALMMAAMMLPGAAPAVQVFDRLVATRRREHRSCAGPSWFVAGYLGVWCLFSLAATVAQATLHATMAMSASMVLTHPLPGAALLAAAGAYQLSALKGRCLSNCRTPLEFLMLHWREGRAGALVMGAQHGTWCVGCCWLLMTVLFVVGVMDLAWIGALTLLVIAEKTLAQGRRVAHVAGWLLLGWAAWRTVGWLWMSAGLPVPG